MAAKTIAMGDSSKKERYAINAVMKPQNGSANAPGAVNGTQ